MDPLPDSLLESLGFYRADDPLLIDGPEWTHRRCPGRFFFHILDAAAVSEALIAIGHLEMHVAAQAAVASIEL